MVSDAVLDLVEAGAVRGVAVSGAALGSQRLFDALATGAPFEFQPVSHTHAPEVLARAGRLCAINSALEIDLAGRAASESAGGRLLGAVGGQLDFLRAAAAAEGTPILALPAARIVEELSGPVTAPAADVDWVVTEHGARRLRGLDEPGRAAALRELSPTKEYA
jgi:acetyl-CoA hydrolase